MATSANTNQKALKNAYLVHMTLPDTFSEEFYHLASQQREMMSELMENRTVLSYSLDMERKNLWCIIEVEARKSLSEIIRAFPIILDVKLEVHELAFHDAAPVSLPDLILN